MKQSVLLQCLKTEEHSNKLRLRLPSSPPPPPTITTSQQGRSHFPLPAALLRQAPLPALQISLPTEPLPRPAANSITSGLRFSQSQQQSSLVLPGGPGQAAPATSAQCPAIVAVAPVNPDLNPRLHSSTAGPPAVIVQPPPPPPPPRPPMNLPPQITLPNKPLPPSEVLTVSLFI